VSAYGATLGNLPGFPVGTTQDALNRQPSTSSLLSPTAFRFYLNRAPAVTYFCQSASIPEVSLETLEQPTTVLPVNQIDSRVSLGDLTIRFLVDEDMKNWLEIYDWMRGIAAFEDLDNKYHPNQHKCDAKLMILTGAMNSNIEVSFEGVFPTSLSNLEFDSSTTDIDYITADVTLAIESFNIHRL
jgi:hypothetical protein